MHRTILASILAQDPQEIIRFAESALLVSHIPQKPKIATHTKDDLILVKQQLIGAAWDGTNRSLTLGNIVSIMLYCSAKALPNFATQHYTGY